MKPEEDYTVAEFMNKDVVEVTLETPVINCAKVMAAEKVSSAVIMDNNVIVGIITEKDLARKVVAKGIDPKKVKVKDVMTSDLVTVEPEMTLYDAMLLLSKRKIKHIPVVKGNVLVGIITAMDILRVQPSYMELLASKREESP